MKALAVNRRNESLTWLPRPCLLFLVSWQGQELTLRASSWLTLSAPAERCA